MLYSLFSVAFCDRSVRAGHGRVLRLPRASQRGCWTSAGDGAAWPATKWARQEELRKLLRFLQPGFRSRRRKHSRKILQSKWIKNIINYLEFWNFKKWNVVSFRTTTLPTSAVTCGASSAPSSAPCGQPWEPSPAVPLPSRDRLSRALAALSRPRADSSPPADRPCPTSAVESPLRPSTLPPPSPWVFLLFPLKSAKVPFYAWAPGKIAGCVYARVHLLNLILTRMLLRHTLTKKASFALIPRMESGALFKVWFHIKEKCFTLF